MKLSPTSLPVKLGFLAGYPALSVAFVVLGLGGLWGPWVGIAASALFVFTGLLLGRLVQEYPSFNSSGAPYIFLSIAWLGALLLAALAAGREFLYAGLGFLLDTFLIWFVYKLLRKRNFLERLRSGQTYVWFMFIFSAAIPTSVALSNLRHLIDLSAVTTYGVVFGWFGPEVIPRIAAGRLRPVLLVGAYLFLMNILYIFLETVNPAFGYPATDLGVAVFLSYLACYSMLVSRCTMEALKPPKTDKE